MHIYKFRMLYAENEDFVRDYELQATQTFEDFHRIVTETVGLDYHELSSFHICDQKWNKMKEITLIDMMEGSDIEEKDAVVEETYVMKDALIRDFIDEPRQRLVYEHDFVDMKTFFIELQSVFKQKEDADYPRCTFKRGKLNHENEATEIVEEDDEELRKQLIQDFEDILDDTIEENPETD